MEKYLILLVLLKPPLIIHINTNWKFTDLRNCPLRLLFFIFYSFFILIQCIAKKHLNLEIIEIKRVG
jgi:hypothetical protein